MTHIETHDLLLDLAYGELPAHVAAEVSQHLEGCAECKAESAQLDGVRKAFSPIHELEEPSDGFDDRILAAARAEALLEHDGNIGQVIEGAGSFAPVGITAASVDAHAAPVAPPASRRKPRWMMRALVGGSAATAAALALMVGIRQPTHRAAQPAESYAIHVSPQGAPAPEAPPAVVQPAAPKAEAAAAPAQSAAADNRSSAYAQDSAQRSKMQPARRAEAKKKAATRAVDEGSGGDVPSRQELALGRHDQNSAGAPAAAPPAVEREAAPPVLDAQNVVVTGSSVRRRDPAPSGSAASDNEPAAVVANSDEAPADAVGGAAAENQPPPPAPRSPAKAASASRVSKAAVPTQEDPADLEHRAEAARHDGNYALAAGLYREAATGHNSNSRSAAWDLAHAVECLAAAGAFDDARRVSDQLQRLFPTEITAFAAARRALREVDTAPSK